MIFGNLLRKGNPEYKLEADEVLSLELHIKEKYKKSFISK